MVNLGPKRADIDGADHFAEHLSDVSRELDLRMESRRWRRSRRGADHNRREGQEVVGLDDDRIPLSMLHSAAAAGQRDLVNVTADHAAPPSEPRPLALPQRRRGFA
jgi:hypothetical protein